MTSPAYNSHIGNKKFLQNFVVKRLGM